MIKLIGALLIIGGSTFIGFLIDKLERYRMNDLKNLQRALIFLKGEIDYMITPLPVAMEQVGNRIGDNIGQIFIYAGKQMMKKTGYTVTEIWKESVNSHIDNTYLSKEDKNILLSLGNALGYLDKEMQKNNIDLSILYLKEEIKRLDMHHQKNGRLYRSLGILGGLLIVILLY
ncbi:stage III sporulation protein SpoIIIAB [Defluviitalea phaphyphila]|uniref:stage III sporulation protein SpoIIIAB n=1 Tax=Defluviitalea phaphyphila TaxID=1473580 RepID=UPI00072FF5BA|nr:stage III sporulation protein SpoIIIAB [Defluviitalea phaphyphila]